MSEVHLSALFSISCPEQMSYAEAERERANIVAKYRLVCVVYVSQSVSGFSVMLHEVSVFVSE